MLIESLSAPYQKSHATAATDTSFPARSPTATEPAGDGVIDLGAGGALAQNGLMLVPFGAGSNNDTFDMRVWGWRSVGSGVSRVWVPVILAQFACTLSAAVGVAGGAVTATDRFCDTITLTSPFGNANVSNEIVSPANDTPAHVVLDAKGCQKVEVVFDLGAGTNANCLVAKL